MAIHYDLVLGLVSVFSRVRLLVSVWIILSKNVEL